MIDTKYAAISERPVALVTGGARRMGAAVSADLAAHGFAVAVHYDSSANDADDLCREIIKKGGMAAAFHADLCNDSPADLLKKVTHKLGAPALLVNNASLFHDDSIGNLNKKFWDKHFKLHVEAPVFLAEAMLKAMADSVSAKKDAKKREITADISKTAIGQKQGLIVNIIDQRVWHLNPHFFSYTLSKAALWTATQTLAQALAPHIRVNAIGPGPSFKNNKQTEEDFFKQCEILPLQSGPKSEEFGKTIRYLWETPSITGQMLALDGGQHLMWKTEDVRWDKSEAEK